MGELTHLSLFSGIGGLDLAAEWAGFETVGQCEWADYPTKVLEKHWPDVPRWRDIRTLTGESFYERTGLRTVDIISGGFPCQPFSVAGKQRGKEDDRFLWPEMVRVIKELRPTWAIGENVAGIINLALDDVLSDLEAEGYATRTFLIPACGVGAPHQRYRTAIVAWDTNGRNERAERGMEERENPEPTRVYKDVANASIEGIRRLPVQPRESRQAGTDIIRSGEDVANTDSTRREEFDSSEIPDWQGFSSGNGYEGTVCNTASPGLQDGTEKPLGKYREKQEPKRPDWWSAEPGVGRVANGISNRVDRLRCLGNAVVPQQFYPIFQAIADIELQNQIEI